MVSNIFSSSPSLNPRLFMTPPNNTTVLIVGSGPTGLLASYLLAKNQISSVVVEKYARRLYQPKAHAINPRTIEILRQAGLDVSWLRSQGASANDAFCVRWILGLTDEELGKLPYERQDDEVKALTPEPLLNVTQRVLEAFLEDAALSTGLVSIHRDVLWERASFTDDDTPVSHLRRRSDGTMEPITIASQYLIGADGAESSVRNAMQDIEFGPPGGLVMPKRYYRSIHGHGDLRSALDGMDRPSQLYFCIHEDHPAGAIAYDLSTSFVHVTLLSESFVDDGSAPTYEECRAIVKPCMPTVLFEPQAVAVWYTWPRVASSYSSRGGRILLVGDATHSFPPQ